MAMSDLKFTRRSTGGVMSLERRIGFYDTLVRKKCRLELTVLRAEGPSTIRACPGGLITEWLQDHPKFQLFHLGRSIAKSDGAAEMGWKDNGFLGNGSYSVIAPTGASPVGAILVAAPPA